MFKVSKKNTHQNNISNIFKVNSKNIKKKSGASIFNFEHILYFILLLSLLNLKKINAGWAWETKVSDNKFISSNCGKYIVPRAEKICWATCFRPYLHPASSYLLKVKNRNTRTRCEIFSKLIIKTLLLTLNLFHPLF